MEQHTVQNQILEPTLDNDGWRWYGNKPSVTTILGQTIANKKKSLWSNPTIETRVSRAFLDPLNFGIELHEYYWKIGKGEPLGEISKDHQPFIDSFRKWSEKHKVRVIASETIVASEKYGFAGTLDFFGEIDGELMIADWKNVSRYDIKYGWQLGAYRIAAIEMNLVPDTVGLMGVQIDKRTQEVKTFKYEHIDFVEHAFLCTLEAFKALHYRKLERLNWPWLGVRAV